VDNDVQDLTSCETCHAGSYNGYPCYSCHEQGEMGDTHRLAGVEGGHENCVECHPSGRNGAVVSTDSTSWQPYQKGPTLLVPAANKPKDLPNQEGKDQPLKNKTKQGQPGSGMNSSPWATHQHDPPPAERESLIPGQHRSQQATVSWTSGK
jgi:hypothetical protein